MKSIQQLSFIALLHAPITLAFVTPPARIPTKNTIYGEESKPLALFSTMDQRPDTRFNNLIYVTDDTIKLLRDELKSRLLKAADEYKERKAEESSDVSIITHHKSKEVDEGTDSGDRGYVLRLLHRIVRKISRTTRGNRSQQQQSTPTILSSDSFRQSKLDVGIYGNKVIEIAEQLSLLNPTPIPTLGFKSYGGAPPSLSKLDGNWKLRFTTAADASFPTTTKRGVVTTSQVIDAVDGTLTNVIDFEKGKLTGFRVLVVGEPLSPTDIGLTFRSVKILRKSRFPRLFGEVTIRFPSRLIRWFASRNKVEEEKSMGPYLRLRYVDDNLRMHTTDSGNWFIQTRL